MSLSLELITSTLQTITMVGVSFIISLLCGVPLGMLLILTKHKLLTKKSGLYRTLSVVLNIIRSIPFIILMVAIIPLTRLIVGTSIGTIAAIIPLAFAATPFVARIVENALASQAEGLLETGVAMGATPLQIITRILLPESAAQLIRGFTLTLITLIGYSAMAGAVGGGGLGDFAIRYGYERFDTAIMTMTICILIFLVQALQWTGDALAKHFTR